MMKKSKKIEKLVSFCVLNNSALFSSFLFICGEILPALCSSSLNDSRPSNNSTFKIRLKSLFNIYNNNGNGNCDKSRPIPISIEVNAFMQIPFEN